MSHRIISYIGFGFFILWLGINPSLNAQPASTGITTTKPGLIWQVSGKGLAQPSYLFGTIHQIEKDRFFLPPAFEASFDQSEQLVLEINIANPMVMVKTLTLSLMKDNTSLKDLLSEKDYARVARFFEDSLGMQLSIMNRMKPMLTGSAMLAQMTNGPATSYEQEFVSMAKEAGMKIKALEKVADQMGIFDQIPYEEQAQYLVEMVDSFQVEKAHLQEMVAIYLAQDLVSLDLFMQDMGEMESYDSLLLDNRNLAWIPKMEAYMEEKPTFFAFGAGHLWGDKGVIRLLREAGYKVEAL